jgi:sensor histidine kinase YesM
MYDANFIPLKNVLLKKRLTLILLVFALLSSFYAFLLYKYNFQSKVWLFEAISFFVIHSLFAIILSKIHSYYHSRSAISMVHLSTIVVFVGLYLLFFYQYSDLISSKDLYYLLFLKHSYAIKGLVSFLVLFALVNQFWIDKHILELEREKKIAIENQAKLVRQELNSLKQQFQPHFIFNSLNSISALTISEPKEARKMIFLLSDFLRASIQKKESDFENLLSELEFVKQYLAIEKVRFGERLRVNFEIDKDCEFAKIPNQVIQPLLENAIKHGLYDNLEEINIQISVTKNENSIHFSISNPFSHQIDSKNTGTGFGLSSIKKKLLHLYNRADLLEIKQTENLFCVNLTIPQFEK